jgi:hypothetical protein
MKIAKKVAVILVVIALLGWAAVILLPQFGSPKCDAQINTSCPHYLTAPEVIHNFLSHFIDFGAKCGPNDKCYSPLPTVPGSTEAPLVVTLETQKKLCEGGGGTWLSQYKECEGANLMVGKEKCVAFKGQYFECASPCRHDPKAEMCIALCIKVCKF